MSQSPSLPSTCETARSEDVAVPREPTEAMLNAGCRAWYGTGQWQRHDNKSAAKTDMLDAYDAMLAAAPRPDAAPTPTRDVAAKPAEIRKRHIAYEGHGQRFHTLQFANAALSQAHKDRAFLLPLAERAAALEQENERLKAALKFYAAEERYDYDET
jgi:hypothetical protein